MRNIKKIKNKLFKESNFVKKEDLITELVYYIKLELPRKYYSVEAKYKEAVGNVFRYEIIIYSDSKKYKTSICVTDWVGKHMFNAVLNYINDFIDNQIDKKQHLR